MNINKKHIIVLLIFTQCIISACTQSQDETKANIPEDIKKYALNNEVNDIILLREIDDYKFFVYTKGKETYGITS